MRNVIIVAALVGVLAAGGQMTAVKAEEHGVRLTWQEGFVTIPGTCTNETIGDEDTKKECLGPGPKNATGKVPAVIFMHGCKGISPRQYSVMQLFTRNGYAAFMPDSFARSRPSEACGKASIELPFRFDEVNYALSEIRKIPWIDQKRLVLAGFSSGGLAVAEYQDYDFAFKTRVILGWGCYGGMSPTAVLVPFLNIVGEYDFDTKWGNKLCIASEEGAVVKHVKAGHDVSENSDSLTIIGDFLAKVLK